MSIEVKNLSFTYFPKTPFEKKAVQDVSFTVQEGETVGIIGSTGSGKSTLIQHLNGLIKLTQGSVKVYDVDLSAKRPDLKKLRATIGMLFQYPEYQLFEETVLKDVCFGPLNFGFSKEDAERAAKDAIRLVGLDYESVKEKSPFELSGGEKRRAAIAGVIAYRPSILILDEPTAGLDPAGKREILDLVQKLKRATVKTVIMISHNMDEIAAYTDRVLVMRDGQLLKDCAPRELFADEAVFEGTGLRLPHAANVARLLRAGGVPVEGVPLTAEELTAAILNARGGRA